MDVVQLDEVEVWLPYHLAWHGQDDLDLLVAGQLALEVQRYVVAVDLLRLHLEESEPSAVDVLERL